MTHAPFYGAFVQPTARDALDRPHAWSRFFGNDALKFATMSDAVTGATKTRKPIADLTTVANAYDVGNAVLRMIDENGDVHRVPMSAEDLLEFAQACVTIAGLLQRKPGEA